MFYTGIGSRKTPQEILDTFSRLARQLELDGWTLRSGGADGADTAFEAGVESQDRSAKEIYLPWEGFNDVEGIIAGTKAWVEAFKLAETVHPAWRNLGQGPRKLHARNCFQVLGLDLSTPSSFVVCWTPDGAQDESDRTAKTGGTGTAIVLAARHGIPVINFAREHALSRMAEVMGDIKEKQLRGQSQGMFAGLRRSAPAG